MPCSPKQCLLCLGGEHEEHPLGENHPFVHRYKLPTGLSESILPSGKYPVAPTVGKSACRWVSPNSHPAFSPVCPMSREGNYPGGKIVPPRGKNPGLPGPLLETPRLANLTKSFPPRNSKSPQLGKPQPFG